MGKWVSTEGKRETGVAGPGHAWVKVELKAKLPFCKVGHLITGDCGKEGNAPRLWLSLVTCDMSNVVLH